MDRAEVIKGLYLISLDTRLRGFRANGKLYHDVATDTIKLLQQPVAISRWVKVTGDFTTPGGTPYFVCGRCGGSGHLYGVEYSKRKVLCDGCGSVNIYPWEQAHEVGSSLWEEPKGADKD